MIYISLLKKKMKMRFPKNERKNYKNTSQHKIENIHNIIKSHEM